MSISFPTTRMRRLRLNAPIRAMVQEHHLTAADLVYPIFIHDHEKKDEAIGSMPGQFRLSKTKLLAVAEECLNLGVPALALFPVVDGPLKSLKGEESHNANGLVQRSVRLLKERFPELLVITDVALDPYTSHGQDGIIDDRGSIINDDTISVLVQQALSHAAAGADVVAPSDMMDGRVRRIREALNKENYTNTLILSYAAKYASCFYGPFRDAVGSKSALKGASKASYQMNPANSGEALREVGLDLEEGADIVMVKPGLPYLDIVQQVKREFKVPTFAYQVSGEYAMVKAAAQMGWLDEKQAVLESLLCLKRAGADAVFTYYALDVARWLKES
ncbi:MAG: porphobilinogen synthase [Oligoflexales bacterium]